MNAYHNLNYDTVAVQQMLSFCQELIRTPSPPGREEAVADLIMVEMRRLGYDDVRRDEAGNVIGTIFGSNPDLPSVLFTAHMDHVSPGNLSLWEHNPYAAHSDSEWIHGRGASDAKGAIATQVYLPKALAGQLSMYGNIHVAHVVLEEVGGLGTLVLLEHLKPHYAIMGEATSNNLRNANRGRVLVRVAFSGNSVHASMAKQADLPLYRAAQFLLRLSNLPMASSPIGKAAAIPTRCFTDLPDDNVTPNVCEITIDWRSVPGQTPDKILQQLAPIVPAGGQVFLPEIELTSYTGLRYKLAQTQPPYWIAPEHPFVRAVHQALTTQLKRPVAVQPWSFTTDCGIFQSRGIPILGFSPGEEQYAHTTIDRISKRLMIEAWKAYPAILDAIYALDGQ